MTSQTKQTQKNTLQQAAKCKQDTENEINIYIPIKCEPIQYLLYYPPQYIVAYIIIQYLHSLQKNDIVAQFTIWITIFIDASVQKKYSLSLGKKTPTKDSVQSLF